MDNKDLHITPQAVLRLRTLLAQEDNPKAFFRIRIMGGGCSGFQYQFIFDEVTSPDDVLFTEEDVTVVIDDISLGLIKGAELDYISDLTQSTFVVRNPQASSSCGCGNSFSL